MVGFEPAQGGQDRLLGFNTATKSFEVGGAGWSHAATDHAATWSLDPGCAGQGIAHTTDGGAAQTCRAQCRSGDGCCRVAIDTKYIRNPLCLCRGRNQGGILLPAGVRRSAGAFAAQSTTRAHLRSAVIKVTIGGKGIIRHRIVHWWGEGSTGKRSNNLGHNRHDLDRPQ